MLFFIFVKSSVIFLVILLCASSLLLCLLIASVISDLVRRCDIRSANALRKSGCASGDTLCKFKLVSVLLTKSSLIKPDLSLIRVILLLISLCVWISKSVVSLLIFLDTPF